MEREGKRGKERESERERERSFVCVWPLFQSITSLTRRFRNQPLF